MINFETELEEKIELINNELKKQLKVDYPEIVWEAMRYSVFSDGKRIRPVILLAVCQALGGKTAQALPFACALEMIHTYSLIHDDLPAMDDDDIRRGGPSNHIVYGEAMATLAGDALLNRAFEIMANYCVFDNNLNNIQAMAKIAKYAGAYGMIGGQVMDVRLEGANPTEQELEYVYTNKAAKLFMAAFGAGAHIAGANNNAVSNLENIGQQLGIAFQIKDDLLDLSGSPVFGKPPGSDEKNKKSTYVSVFGAERAEELFTQLSASTIDGIKNLPNSMFLVGLFEKMIHRVK